MAYEGSLRNKFGAMQEALRRWLQNLVQTQQKISERGIPSALATSPRPSPIRLSPCGAEPWASPRILRAILLAALLGGGAGGSKLVWAINGYTIIKLGTLPNSTGIYPESINNNGQIVGIVALTNSQYDSSFLYSKGTINYLTSNVDVLANGINDSGQVVGGNVGIAFLYNNGVMTNLGTLDNGPYPGSEAFGINDNGQIAGVSSTNNDNSEVAFVYGNGTMSSLGTLGGHLVHLVARPTASTLTVRWLEHHM